MRIKEAITSLPGIRGAVSRLRAYFEYNQLVREFPQYVPNSSGAKPALAHLTWQAIHETLPALVRLSEGCRPAQLIECTSREFAQTAQERKASEALGELFNKYKSDKAQHHEYHYIYGTILARAHHASSGILEVGLGSRDPNVISTMAQIQATLPGASLRAFREHTGSPVYGADIDRNALFEEPGIKTFFVDQTRPETLAALGAHLPGRLGLVIDDGLHSPHANIHTLLFGLACIEYGGWVVIEDIAPAAISLWKLVANLLPAQYQTYLITDKKDMVFAVRRYSE